MFCPRCGHGDYVPGLYCTNCGYHQSQPIHPANSMPQAQISHQSQQPVQSIQQIPTQAPQPVQQVPTQVPRPVQQVTTQAPQPVQQVPVQVPRPVQQVPTQAPRPVQQVTTQVPRPVQQVTTQVPRPVQQVTTQAPQPVQQVPVQAPRPVQHTPVQTQPPTQYSQPQAVTQDSPAQKGHGRKNKPPKTKKKRSTKQFFKKLGIFVVILAFIGLLWFSIGNYITLTIHSNEVVSTINSGSLDVNGVYNNAYKQLPTYVQNQIKAPENKNGILIDLILPYIDIETSQINGFFGNSTVEYKVIAPDLEDWFMQLNSGDIVTTDHFLSVLNEYLATAPRAARKVTVKYTPDGLFQWKGNYNTPEFIDAITGGLNTAYSQMYKQIMDELKEAMQ